MKPSSKYLPVHETVLRPTKLEEYYSLQSRADVGDNSKVRKKKPAKRSRWKCSSIKDFAILTEVVNLS